MKKLFFVFVIVLTVFLSVSSYAANIVAGGECNENVNWTYDADCTITISGTGAMPSYMYSRSPWYSFSSYIKKVVIEEGVTSISDKAFNQCTSLEEVVLSSTVKSIYSEAFSYCDNLKAVSFSAENNLSWFGDSAFENCKKLENIEFSDLLTSVGKRAFYKCELITESPANLKSLGTSAFNGCISLESATLPTSDTYTTLEEHTFKDCKSLKSIIIPKNVTTVGTGAFMGCTSLESIQANYYLMTIKDKAFYKCSSLKSAEIPVTVINIGADVFYGCNNLTVYGGQNSPIHKYAVKNNKKFEVSSNVYRIRHGEVNESVFWELDNHHRLTVTGNGIINSRPWKNYSIYEITVGEGITYICNNAFKDNHAFRVTLPSTLEEIGDWAFSMTDRGAAEELVLPKKLTSVGKSAFRGWSSLKSVTFSSGITDIPESLFSDCTSLEKVIFPTTLKTIGDSAFVNCTNLKDISFPEGLESIGAYSFANCDSLTEVNLPESVKTIGEKAFADCLELREVFVLSSDAAVEYGAFMDCPKLVLRGYKNSVIQTYADRYNIPFLPILGDVVAEGLVDKLNWAITEDGVLVISGKGAIPNYTKSSAAPWKAYADKVSEIVIEDGVTGIGNLAFYNMSNAEKLTCAESVVSVGLQFIRGTKIKSVSLMGALVISNGAFASAESLESVTLSEKMRDVRGNPFFAENVVINAPTDSYIHRFTELYSQKYPSSNANVTFKSTGKAQTPVVGFGSAGESVFYAIYENGANNWHLEISGMGKMKNFPYVSQKQIDRGYTMCPTYYLSLEGLEKNIKSAAVLDGIESIGNYIFYKCTKMESVDIGQNVSSIGMGAFHACVRLKNITLPEGLVSIGNYAFNGCTALESMNIPDSVNEIGEDIFVKCNVENITFDTHNRFFINYLGLFSHRATLLRLYEPEIVYNSDTKKMETISRALVEIDGVEEYVLLNRHCAIDNYTLEDEEFLNYCDLAEPVLVYYSVDENGYYSLYIIESK